jgi:hypothetical protein
MRLGDLLRELRANILHDRSDQVAGASDYYWSDETLVRYIDEAQRRFARRSRVLRDSRTAQCCQIVTIAHQEDYPLDPSVISVISIKMHGDHADLARAGHSNFNTYHTPDNYYFNPSYLSTLPPGKALAYDTDETLLDDGFGSTSAMNLRLFPKISTAFAGITGYMRVIRMPLMRLTLENLDAIPEIPEDHHLNMLDWAGYLALRSPDLDIAGDDGLSRAKGLAASFEQHCIDAKIEMERKVLVQPAFGFGRNGFSYVGN